MGLLCNYTSYLVDNFKVNYKVLLEECLQLNTFEASAPKLMMQRPHVKISSSDHLCATVIVHLATNELILRGGLHPVAEPKFQGCWSTSFDKVRWDKYDPEYRGKLLDSILNFFSCLCPVKERCEISVDVHASSIFAATLTIECPSSAVQHLVGLVHEWYLNQLANHGNTAFSWFAIIACLSPKYWDPADFNCLTELVNPQCGVFRLNKFYQTELPK